MNNKKQEANIRERYLPPAYLVVNDYSATREMMISFSS